jgi:hypothetical protein
MLCWEIYKNFRTRFIIKKVIIIKTDKEETSKKEKEQRAWLINNIKSSAKLEWNWKTTDSDSRYLK